MSDLTKGGGAFAKAVQKTLVRTKTKVLQRVGKAEKTSDESFKQNVNDFQKQQDVALRLQKELKHYLACAQAMTRAANSLYSVIKETYEQDWLNPQAVDLNLNSLDLIQTNYEAELGERVLPDLNSYLEQFPVYKEKIRKRRNKLLDFDNAKHEYETLAAAKKQDHAKICKAQESLQEAKSLFEEINLELLKELPKFYDHRVEFLANNLHKLFTAEGTYHNSCGKMADQLVELLQTLATTHAKEMKRLEKMSMEQASPSEDQPEEMITEEPEAVQRNGLDSMKDTVMTPTKDYSLNRSSQVKQRLSTQSAADPPVTPRTENNNPLSNTSLNGPIFLYQVIATHPYTAEDDDELTFDASDVINVVDFDDDDEQDDGWLMGIHAKTNVKGVFPANFTQRVPKS